MMIIRPSRRRIADCANQQTDGVGGGGGGGVGRWGPSIGTRSARWKIGNEQNHIKDGRPSRRRTRQQAALICVRARGICKAKGNMCTAARVCTPVQSAERELAGVGGGGPWGGGGGGWQSVRNEVSDGGEQTHAKWRDNCISQSEETVHRLLLLTRPKRVGGWGGGGGVVIDL